MPFCQPCALNRSVTGAKRVVLSAMCPEPKRNGGETCRVVSHVPERKRARGKILVVGLPKEAHSVWESGAGLQERHKLEHVFSLCAGAS